jgi:hypothetical protein
MAVNLSTTAVTSDATCEHAGAATPMNSRLSGRWDRNRTCTLRLWSLLPYVQGRSRKYTKGLKMGHFDGPKYVEVHQSSPALGSILGSNQLGALVSSKHPDGSRSCRLDCSYRPVSTVFNSFDVCSTVDASCHADVDTLVAPLRTVHWKRSRFYASGAACAGMMPSCCNWLSWSTTCQCSAILPSSMR